VRNVESLEIVIKVRRIDLAVVASLILHALFFLLVPVRQHVVDTEGGSTEPPLTVRLVEREPAAEAASPEPAPTPVPPPIASRPAIMTRLVPHGPLEAPETVVPPQPQPEPTPPRPPEPPVDMMAAINARREARRAAEAAAARGTHEPTGDEIARANIARNLKGPGEGVGGVFQILSKGTRTAEFAFNGWRPDTDKRWREVIEVDAGLGGDVDRAIVKRMIELIRTHYQGDFKWESHNLGRTVTLSARAEDNDGLEDFLVREFFGTPMVNSRR
jgi:type IV secretory pathway VirB10-like protein